jgi:hypothetical protein
MTAAGKKTWIAKIFARVANFIDWLAKGQEGNLPCSG